MYYEFLKVRLYPAAVVMTSMFGSIFSPVYATEKPYDQKFVVTAYYSPVPDQCCYFRGSYEEDIAFNGKGIAGADGTGVYPGMIAAPATYAFGTVIDLQGLGVGTVHDRGGRIVEWSDDLHRIDLWMGYGEEGLARALAWGTRTVKGKVYPVGTDAPAEQWSLHNFDADPSNIAHLPKNETIDLLPLAAMGDQSYSVRVLQTTLQELGYFDDKPTGTFGEVTKSSLKKFLSDYAVAGDGSNVDDTAAATLMAATSITEENLPIIGEGIAEGTHGDAVRQIQKILRYLGAYRGRTDGKFDQDVREAVTQFQLNAGVIQSATQDGAGRVGPVTKAAMLKAWKVRVVTQKAKAIATKMHIAKEVKTAGLPTKTLASGDRGPQVRSLQRFLHDAGYLPASDMTGTFGARTRAALLKYQIDRSIVASAEAKGAGIFGPATRQTLSKDAVDLRWKLVRAEGIGAQ
jgi:peptidoglycan hydrolase-like protein with peptidoglycan-binding domain